jgi:hypothetical protein
VVWELKGEGNDKQSFSLVELVQVATDKTVNISRYYLILLILANKI